MLTAKRVIIATICGFVFGLVCMWLASSGDSSATMTPVIKWSIILGRTMLGFTIGISAIRLNWWLHGIVIGAIASIAMAVPILPDVVIAVSTVVMGIIYGFLTELITSVLFKAKSPANS